MAFDAISHLVRIAIHKFHVDDRTHGVYQGKIASVVVEQISEEHCFARRVVHGLQAPCSFECVASLKQNTSFFMT